MGRTMSRSGYSDSINDVLAAGRWRAQVKSAISGKRGQSFLRELASAMDAMPVKELIKHELIDEDGSCCAIGVVCKSRGVDFASIDVSDNWAVGELVGIAHQMAAEIEYLNDECCERYETPKECWLRMRKWVQAKIVNKQTEDNK